MFFFSQLEGICGGRIVSRGPDREVRHIVTDSRRAILRNDALFFAIRGVHHDGHAFIAELYERGIRQFVVEREVELPQNHRDPCNMLLVGDSIAALQALAAAHRLNFDLGVVAVTGSNGKTIVKEWLSTLLAAHYRVAKTPKSYNSQIGVPLSVWQLESWHQLAIFEAGISVAGEMDRLAAVIRPQTGIFTNLGPAHDEGFGSRAEKLREKWKLFASCERVIYCADQPYISDALGGPPPNGFTWGRHETADLRIAALDTKGQSATVQLLRAGTPHFFTIPFSDHASVENALHCIAFCLLRGLPDEAIQAGLQALSPVSMRLSLLHGLNDCYLVDDSYSNDLAGLVIALDFLQQQPRERRTAVLSDIRQSGLEDALLYREVNAVLKSKGVYRLYGIGSGISRQPGAFDMEAHFYADTEAFLSACDPACFHNEAILIKGARAFGFERIVRKMMQRIHGTVLEIDLDALVHNLNYYRARLRPGVRIMAMVKALAYGSGSNEVAALLQYHKVDYLAVAYAEEGVELRRNGISLPVMVMNPAPDSFEKMADFGLEAEIYSLGQFREYIDFVRSRGREGRIHLKIDTGMHRLGFMEEDLSRLLALLQENPGIRVMSLYTHLAGADEEIHTGFTRDQVARFEAVSARVADACRQAPLRHVLNSAGIVRFPEYQFDMVRIGVGLYGFESSRSQPEALRPVSTLKTVISQLRHLRAGDTVGYGRRGLLHRDSVIATIAIGYADGFFRAFGNGVARVMVNGQPAPVVGSVCMDMTMIDVTGIPAAEGDEVVIFGQNPRVEELAAAIGTIPYELLTNISERVKRVFFRE
jgi:Alr-MurF fusion protein